MTQIIHGIYVMKYVFKSNHTTPHDTLYINNIQAHIGTIVRGFYSFDIRLLQWQIIVDIKNMFIFVIIIMNL